MPHITLASFYTLMQATVPARRCLVESTLDTCKPDSSQLDILRKTLDNLRSLPLRENRAVVALAPDSELTIDLDYEIHELERDLLFFDSGEDALLDKLSKDQPDLSQKTFALTQALKKTQFETWFTDRDGTVNNYCGRYLSSIQSAYNAVFLSRFARTIAGRSIILTSAPLDNGGIVDISVGPLADFVYAGSKGREYRGDDNKRQSLPIEPSRQLLIDNLNKELQNLLQQPHLRKFALIGSGFQQKFGQTTVARQDIGATIDQDESDRFLDIVRATVAKVDPSGTGLTIEDTGKDIEIIATIDTDQPSTARDFDKGDGVRFLVNQLGIRELDKPCLVCGDTASDIPMIHACAALFAQTTGVLVTRDLALQQMAKETGVPVHCADSPDVLVCALNELSRL